MTLKLQIGACNGLISTFELSTIIMRHEVAGFARWLPCVRCWSVNIFVLAKNCDFAKNWPI